MTHLAGLLAAWLPVQRWFADAGTAVRDVTITSDVVLSAGDPELRHLIADVGTDGGQVSYQVLVGLRAAAPPELAGAAIGTLADGRIAYDAMADAELTRLLVGRIAAGRGAGTLSFAAVPGAVVEPTEQARLLPAVTSNTSVVFGEKTILKVLRRPFEGHHPDLEIPAALAARGSKLVAAPLGWIEMTEPTDAAAPTTLAILSEYLPGARDGWSLATASMDVTQRDHIAGPDHAAQPAGGSGPSGSGPSGSGVSPGDTVPGDTVSPRASTAQPDFTAQAHELGRVTAWLHAELAAAFGTRVLSPTELTELTGAMTAELARAVAIVPELAAHAAGIQACYALLAKQRDEIVVQRVHGDYHLVQVLSTDQGWVVLDFEGEPSVPLAQRRAFAPALRDVAGMLRSFDYAARHQALRRPQDQRFAAAAAEWVNRCQHAFCAGYAGASGTDLRGRDPLLQALILSKAVYEAVYEAGHRPGWLSIPLDALAEATRMAADTPGGERETTRDRAEGESARASRRGAAPSGRQSEERATSSDGALRAPGGERET